MTKKRTAVDVHHLQKPYKATTRKAAQWQILEHKYATDVSCGSTTDFACSIRRKRERERKADVFGKISEVGPYDGSPFPLSLNQPALFSSFFYLCPPP